MYNALRHDSIVSGIKKAVEEAFAFSEKPSMVLTPLGVEFSILNPSFSPSSDSFSFSLLNDKVAFSSLDVISLLSFVLNHAIIKQGSHFFRQTKGIPMGGNASPDIANLYCYSVEATYVDKMVNAKLWDIVAACTRIKRYIDDFACFSSTPPPAESYDMSYTCTSSLTPKNHVIDLDYIGLRLRLELGKTPEKNWIRMGVANKARKWNFTPVRFPHAGSVAPQSQGGGVFKGLCIRAICLCNNSNDLLLELVRTVYDMLDRGHLVNNLTTTFYLFLQERMTTAPFDRDLLLKSFKHIVGAYERQEKCGDVVVDAWFVGPNEPCGDLHSVSPTLTLPSPHPVASALKRSASTSDDCPLLPPSVKRTRHVQFNINTNTLNKKITLEHTSKSSSSLPTPSPPLSLSNPPSSSSSTTSPTPHTTADEVTNNVKSSTDNPLPSPTPSPRIALARMTTKNSSPPSHSPTVLPCQTKVANNTKTSHPSTISPTPHTTISKIPHKNTHHSLSPKKEVGKHTSKKNKKEVKKEKKKIKKAHKTDKRTSWRLLEGLPPLKTYLEVSDLSFHMSPKQLKSLDTSHTSTPPIALPIPNVSHTTSFLPPSDPQTKISIEPSIPTPQQLLLQPIPNLSTRMSANVSFPTTDGNITLAGIPRPITVYHCALSSVLQAFRIITPLQSLLTHALPCLQPLSSLPNLLTEERLTFISSLWNELGFTPTQQEDVVDVLEKVLDVCFQNSARDLVDKTFAFSIWSVLACPEKHCDHTTVSHDMWGSSRILHFPLTPFSQDESLFTSDNIIQACPKCTSQQLVNIQKISYKFLFSDVLCLSIDRSRLHGKNTTPFSPPPNISTPFGHKYVLQYQCSHQGYSSRSGHWVGFIFNHNAERTPFAKIDDGAITRAKLNDEDLLQGVLFFYTKEITGYPLQSSSLSQYFLHYTSHPSITASFISLVPTIYLRHKRLASDSKDLSKNSTIPPTRRLRTKPPSRMLKRKASETVPIPTPPARRKQPPQKTFKNIRRKKDEKM